MILSPPRFYPKLASLYRAKVEDLHRSLTRSETRVEAANILRGLIERVEVCFTDKRPQAELIGDIVKLLSLPKIGTERR